MSAGRGWPVKPSSPGRYSVGFHSLLARSASACSLIAPNVSLSCRPTLHHVAGSSAWCRCSSSRATAQSATVRSRLKALLIVSECRPAETLAAHGTIPFSHGLRGDDAVWNGLGMHGARAWLRRCSDAVDEAMRVAIPSLERLADVLGLARSRRISRSGHVGTYAPTRFMAQGAASSATTAPRSMSTSQPTGGKSSTSGGAGRPTASTRPDRRSRCTARCNVPNDGTPAAEDEPSAVIRRCNPATFPPTSARTAHNPSSSVNLSCLGTGSNRSSRASDNDRHPSGRSHPQPPPSPAHAATTPTPNPDPPPTDDAPPHPRQPQLLTHTPQHTRRQGVAHTGMGNPMTASRPAAKQPAAAAWSPGGSQEHQPPQDCHPTIPGLQTRTSTVLNPHPLPPPHPLTPGRAVKPRWGTMGFGRAAAHARPRQGSLRQGLHDRVGDDLPLDVLLLETLLAGGVLDDELAVEDQAAGALPGGRHQVRPPRSWTSAPRGLPVVDHSHRPHHVLDCDRSKSWRSLGGRAR